MFLSGCSNKDNPAEVSARAGMLGQNLSIIRSARDATWQNAKLPKDVRARIEQDLQEGYWVVFAAQIVHEKEDDHYAWWRVDPTTGQILGIGERGWGQTTTEKYAVITVVTMGVVTLLCVVKKLLASPGGFMKGDINMMDRFNCLCNGLGSGIALSFAVAGQYKISAAVIAAFFKGFCA
jgi:hypothetical protein